MNRAMEILCTFLALGLIGMVLLSVFNVISRYLFDAALLWADEVVIFAMIVLVWLGGIACAWQNSHLRMSLLIERLPAQLRLGAGVAQHVIVAGACGTAAWLSLRFVTQVYRFGMTSDAARVPVWTVHSAVTISLVFIACIAFVKALNAALGRADVRRGDDGDGERS